MIWWGASGVAAMLSARGWSSFAENSVATSSVGDRSSIDSSVSVPTCTRRPFMVEIIWIVGTFARKSGERRPSRSSAEGGLVWAIAPAA